MIDWLWIGIFQEGVPICPSNDLVTNVRIHNLKPCARWVTSMLGKLSVSQVFEALTSFGRAASVRAHHDIEAVEGVLVRFTLALNELIELVVRLNVTQLERHGGGACLLACYDEKKSGEYRSIEKRVSVDCYTIGRDIMRGQLVEIIGTITSISHKLRVMCCRVS